MPEDAVIDQPVSEVAAPAPAVEAPSHEVTESAPESSGPSYQERTEALTGKARDHWKLTGNLDEAEAMVKKTSDAPADSSPAKPGEQSQTEPASGPGEPKGNRQDRDWKNLREKVSNYERELTATKAKLEVYERERAASGPSAPAAPKTEAAPVATSDARPEYPDINAFDDPKKFQEAVRDWQKKDTEWVQRETQRQFDQRFNGEKAKESQAQATKEWNAQIESAKKIHADFESVAFSDKTPISFATLQILHSLPDGALRSYALGQNLELATKIAELTHIPGEHQFQGKDGFAKFLTQVHSNPRLAMLYGEKLGLAKAELAKLTVGKASSAPQPTAPKKTLKEVIAQSPRPSAEVTVDEGGSGPVLDPVARALKIAKETGDPGPYMKAKNDEELRLRKQRQ